MHTETTLKTLSLPELWALYTEATGKTTKAPNKKFLVRSILEAQAEAAPTKAAAKKPVKSSRRSKKAAEPMPEPATDNGPWSGATTIADRVDHVRGIADVAIIDTLLAEPDVQARVKTELAAQRQALSKVVDAATDAGQLRALLGNRQAHTRPGVGQAIRDALAALGADVGADRALGDLSVEELRVVYEAEVGRPTSSEHRGYLVWKIREARKGRIPVGEVTRTRGEPGAEYKVLPLRMEVGEVEALDAAWRAAGFSSRAAFVREAISAKIAEQAAG
jgi:hypothetical protein